MRVKSMARRDEAPDTYTQIVKSAFRQLAFQGGRGLSLRLIAREAGVTRGAPQYYFPHKQQLVEAICRHLMLVTRSRLEANESLLAGRVSSPQMLCDYVVHLILTAPQRIEEHLVWLEIAEWGRTDEAVRPYVEQYWSVTLRHWQEILERLGGIPTAWAAALTEYVDAETSQYLASGVHGWLELTVRENVSRFLLPLTDGDAGIVSEPRWFREFCEWDSQVVSQREEESALPGGSEASSKNRVIHAAIRMIAENGIEALTHRRLAHVAGVSLASTTYHFDNLRDIIDEAFKIASAEARQSVRISAVEESGTNVSWAEIAALLAEHALDTSGPAGQRVRVMKRLYLEAMRSPRLQPLVLNGRQGDWIALHGLLRMSPDIRQEVNLHAAHVWGLWFAGALSFALARFGECEAQAVTESRILEFSPVFFRQVPSVA
jgi:AcrR family transcriptional regulator